MFLKYFILYAIAAFHFNLCKYVFFVNYVITWLYQIDMSYFDPYKYYSFIKKDTPEIFY